MNKSLITVLFIIFSISCVESDVKLDTDLRLKADSVFASQVDSIGSEVDSLCETVKDSLVQLKYDSIIEVRKRRIRELSQ